MPAPDITDEVWQAEAMRLHNALAEACIKFMLHSGVQFAEMRGPGFIIHLTRTGEIVMPVTRH